MLKVTKTNKTSSSLEDWNQRSMISKGTLYCLHRSQTCHSSRPLSMHSLSETAGHARRNPGAVIQRREERKKNQNFYKFDPKIRTKERTKQTPNQNQTDPKPRAPGPHTHPLDPQGSTPTPKEATIRTNKAQLAPPPHTSNQKVK